LARVLILQVAGLSNQPLPTSLASEVIAWKQCGPL